MRAEGLRVRGVQDVGGVGRQVVVVDVDDGPGLGAPDHEEEADVVFEGFG